MSNGLSVLDSVFSEARNRTEYTKAYAAEHVRAGGGVAFPTGQGYGGNNSPFTKQVNLSHHAEQYKHFTGQVFASIRPIAQRVARQPLRVARLDRRRDSSRGGRPGATKNRRKRGRAWTRRSLRNHPAILAKTLPGVYKAYHEQLDVLEEHPILDIIGHPNPIMTRWALMYVTVASLELTGKAYWWFRRADTDDGGSGTGIEVWPLPASWVEPVHDDDRLFVGWEVRPEGMASPFQLEPADIVYFHYPDPASLVGAISPLQAQARAVIADEAIAEAQRKQFSNGIWPGIMLTVGRLPDVGDVPGMQPALTAEQRNQIITAVKQKYRGVGNADEPLILDGVIKDAKRMSYAPRDMDFMNSAEFTQKRIDQGFGVNPIIKGQVEGANRASSATADDHFVSTCVNPKIELISEIMTKFLGRRWGDDLFVYIEEADSFDPDLRRQDEDFLSNRCAISINEVRQNHNMPPIHGGNVCIIPAGMTAVSIIREEKNMPADGGPAGLSAGEEIEPLDDEDEDDEGSEDDEASTLPIRNVDCKALIRERGYKSVGQTMSKDQLVDAWGKSQRRSETEMAKAARSFFRAEADRLAAALARRGGDPDPGLIGDVFGDGQEKFADRMRKAMTPVMVKAAIRGALVEWELHRPRRNATRSIDPSGVKLPDEVRDAAERAARKAALDGFWSEMAETTRQQLIRAARNAAAGGKEGKELVRQALTVLNGRRAAERADGIAVTESTAMHNAGQHQARKKLEQLGVVRYKVWTSMRDARVRDTHREADGQKVTIRERFTVGGVQCMFPSDPDLPAKEKCNCRCTTVTLTEGRRTTAVRRKQAGNADPTEPGVLPLGGIPDVWDRKPTGRVLEVPDVRQETDYDCGAAAALAVVRYHGVGDDSWSVADAMTALDTNATEGTPPYEIGRYMTRLGLPTATATGMTVDQLGAYCDQGWPVLVPVQALWCEPFDQDRCCCGHWVVVTGVTNPSRGVKTVHVHDPSMGTVNVKADDFERCWFDTGKTNPDGQNSPSVKRYERMGLAVGPKGKGA